MLTATLLEKLYGSLSLKPAESQIQSLCKGLNVAVKVAEVTNRGWIRVSVSGEDEVAALSLLDEKFSIAPLNVKNVKEDTIQKGKIIFSGKSSMEIYVDIGVFLHAPMDATIALQHLQAQLVDGKKLPLMRIVKLFCLLNNFPLEILIKRVDRKRKCFVAELSEKQVALTSQWTWSNLERLVLLGTFLPNVERAVKSSGHLRDVVEIESLGMMEHAVVCKLGTNSAGLIPKIGRLLPNVTFGVFLPKEIQRFMEA